MKNITGMNLNISAIKMYSDIPECIMVEGIRHVMQADDHLNALPAYEINGLLSIRTEFIEEIQPYCPF